MSQIVIGDISPYTQATAIASQTVFMTNWTANVYSDVVVYQTPSGDVPSDISDLLQYPQDYSVIFVGDQLQVQVTLVTPAGAGDIITITRQTPADRMNLYSNTNFLPSMLNNDFGILTLVDQQAQLVDQLVGPRYNYSAVITDVVDTILPILGANQCWAKNPGDTAIIPYTLPSSGIAPANASYVTIYNETAALPNSVNFVGLTDGIVVFSDNAFVTTSVVNVANQTTVANGTGVSGSIAIGIASNAVIPGTAGMGIPVGTTLQRITPTSPSVGFRYNTTEESLEFYKNGSWTLINDNTDGVILPGLNNQLTYYVADGITVGGLTSGNNGVLITSNSGVPSWLANGTADYLLTANSGAPPSWQPASSIGAILTIDGDSGSASPVDGVITISGGTTGLTTSGTSATLSLTGTLKLGNGGTNAALTASNGGIFYSTATAGAILSGTATANQMLQSGSSTTPTWSTTTWPPTTSINTILYSSSASVIGQISAVDNGVLISGTTGIPSFLANGTASYILTANSGAPPSWQANAALGGVTSIAGTANEITSSASTGSVTLSIPSVWIAPGTITATTSTTSPSFITQGTTSGNVTIESATGTYNFILPATSGTSGYFLTSAAGGTLTWTNAGSGWVNSISGTANEITASASTGAVTLSIPSAFIAPGSVVVTTTLGVNATPAATQQVNFTSSNAVNLQMGGTQTAQTGGTNQVCLSVGSVLFEPATNAGACYAVNVTGNMAPPMGVTISTGYGISIASIPNSGAGSVTNCYGLKVGAPSAGGTINQAIYTDNMAIGYASTDLSGTHNLICSGTGTFGASSHHTSATLSNYGGYLFTQYNTQTPPTIDSSGGLSIGWNQTGGGGEVDFFNCYSTTPGAGFFFYQYNSTNSAYQNLISVFSNTNLSGAIQFENGNSGMYGGQIAGDTTYDLRLNTQSSNANPIRIDGSYLYCGSNVGIGKSPSFPLDVNGTVNCGGLSVGAATTQSAGYAEILNGLGIGGPPASSIALYVQALASNSIIMDITGTAQGTTGLIASHDISAVSIAPVLKPSGTINYALQLYIYPQPDASAATSTTIPIFASLFIASGALASGTVTTSYGAYISTPSFGTVRQALYTDNLSVGYSTTNLSGTNDVIIAGGLSVGTATTQGGGYAEIVNGLGIGTGPSSAQGLLIEPNTNVWVGINIAGTFVADSSADQVGIYLGAIYSPTNNNKNVYAVYAVPSIEPYSTNIVTTACAVYGYVTGSVGSGSVTSSYSGYFVQPALGTNAVALYSDSLSIGYTATSVSTNNAIISGSLSVGSNYQTVATILAEGINSLPNIMDIGHGAQWNPTSTSANCVVFDPVVGTASGATTFAMWKTTMQFNTAHNLGTAYGLWVPAGLNSGEGNITNAYSAYFDTQTFTTGFSYALGLGGSIQLKHVTASTTYSLLAQETYVGVTTSGGAVLVVLPASAPVAGTTWFIYDRGGDALTNNIKIDTNGLTLNGSASASTSIILTNYGFYHIVSDGTNYFGTAY